jgi:hypothetical protein
MNRNGKQQLSEIEIGVRYRKKQRKAFTSVVKTIR